MTAPRRVFAVLGFLFALSDLAQAGQTIYWKKDYIPDGNGGALAVATPQPSDTTAPSTPTNFASTGTTSGSASLIWTASTDPGGIGVTGYRVFRGVSIVGVVNTTHFTDVALTPSTGYAFKVAAFDGAGNQSALSGEVSVTTDSGSGPPDAPGMLTATAAGTSQVNVAWTAPPGSVDHYEVWRRTTGSYSKVAEPSSAAYSDTGVSANTAYVYKVCAVNGSGSSAFSNADVATTMVFTDAITAGVVVKAQHLTELRDGVDRVRAAAGWSGATWTDPSPAGVGIKAIHVMELRNDLRDALLALGVIPPEYEDQTITSNTHTAIKAAHIGQLRDAMK